MAALSASRLVCEALLALKREPILVKVNNKGQPGQ